MRKPGNTEFSLLIMPILVRPCYAVGGGNTNFSLEKKVK